MEITEIKKISNPYRINHRLSHKDFIGRADEIGILSSMLDEFKKSSELQNIIISGNKSIGKSTLLYRYKQVLEDYGFIVFEKELSRDANNNNNEFDFFYELINQIFLRYAPPENMFFDSSQAAIWFNLTNDKYEHPTSNYTDRKISFATRYANYKKGAKETLSYSEIQNDFKRIISEIITDKMGFSGLAILIDEFQELSKNILLMDFLRQLSENVTNIIIIGAGVPTISNNPSFEKILRISRTCSLKNLSERERLNLIYTPLQKHTSLTRHEVEDLFNNKSLDEVVNRTEGNPLHIQVLCHHMFNYFSKNPTCKEMILNRPVMDEVIDYYARISEKSMKIKNSLSSCTKDKLEIFNEVFRYEGFTLKIAILCKLAFNKVTSESEESVRNEVFNNLKEINDLDLFEFSGDTTVLSQIETLKIDKLANIQCKFIGDSIDKLYVSYFYEELAKKPLSKDSAQGFDNHLASKLAVEICSKIISSRVTKENKERKQFYSINESLEINKTTQADIKSDLNKLLLNSKKKKINEESNQLIQDISKKYGFDFPSTVARIFGYNGYLILFSDVEIRGKKKKIINFISLKEDDLENLKENHNELIDISKEIQEPLDQYYIKINWVYLHIITLEPLVKIFYIDIDGIKRNLFNNAMERNFEDAINFAEAAHRLDISIEENKLMVGIEDTNNFAFCLMNNNEISKAEKLFRKIAEHSILGKVNLAQIHFEKGKQFWSESTNILKQILKKKLGEDKDTSLINLAIYHPELEIKNKIVEDLTISQIASLNLALIYAQLNEEQSIINAFYNKASFNAKAELIKKRVEYWVLYYQSNTKDALTKAESLKLKATNKFFLKDVEKDIQIFKKELKTGKV